MDKVRTVTLVGTLHGTIWMPSTEAQLEVRVDLRDRARSFVNATGSGLVDAVKSVVDYAGDFQSCALTADSTIRFARRTYGPNGYTERVRFVDVTRFPSLADHVDRNAYTGEFA